MIKYRISWVLNEIEAIEITKESDSFVWLKNGRREQKEQRYSQWTNTFREAKAKILEKIDCQIEACENKMKDLTEDYKIASNLTSSNQ